MAVEMVVVRGLGRDREHPQGHQGPRQVDQGFDGIGQQPHRSGEPPGPTLEQDGRQGRGDREPGVASEIRLGHGVIRGATRRLEESGIVRGYS